MKSFSIAKHQIVTIISALIAEEVSRHSKRHFDSLTVASWADDTPVGAGGIGLLEEEYAFCVRRVARFFGASVDGSVNLAEASLGQWALQIENAIQKSMTHIAFMPAGSEDGEPECVHPAEDVFADAAAAANLLYGRRRLLSLVAPHSLLGFTLTVLTPNLHRIPTLDVRSMAPDVLKEALQYGDVLVATPTLWRYALQQGVTAPDNTMGVFFGEPMTAELSAEMRKAGFAAQREIYGSTETGLIGWRDTPTDEFLLFDHWRRDGECLMRSSKGAPDKSVAPMDTLSWVDDRRFNLAGRRDGAVQIGAVNVFPDKIAASIQEHDFVEACLVRVGQYQGGVNRLIAHIKLAEAVPPTEKTVRNIDQWCRSVLTPQSRPGIFHFEADLAGL